VFAATRGKQKLALKAMDLATVEQDEEVHRATSARAHASAAKAGQAASFARLNDEKSELSMLIEDFFVDLAALPRRGFHPTHDLRWVSLMMVVDGLEHDEKLELQRYLLNCSGSSRTSD